LKIALLAPTLFLLFYSLRLTWADWEARNGTAPSLERAVKLDPENARWLARLARVTGRADLLGKAARANPNDARLLIEAGLRAEMEGDVTGAEQLLEAAAERDATYQPRWSLVNFYYRRQQWERFWHWAREAGKINHGELRALYRLCLRAEEDPAAVLRRVVPERAAETRQFVDVLIEDRRTRGLEDAGLRLSLWKRREDLDTLMQAAWLLLAEGEAGAAMRIWNRAVEAGLLERKALDPAGGVWLGNPGFRTPLGAGPFDWRAGVRSGVSVQGMRDGLRLEFSGGQPERTVALEQALPEMAPGEYRLRTRARVEMASGRSGCRWQVVEAGAGAGVTVISEPLGSGTEAGWHEFRFRVAGGVRRLRLELAAGREPGLRRPEGAIELYEAALDRMP
jgi:hypothetical protein